MSKIIYIKQLFDREKDIKEQYERWKEDNKEWLEEEFYLKWLSMTEDIELIHSLDYNECYNEFAEDEFFKVRSRWI
jgi:hypothetical protein